MKTGPSCKDGQYLLTGSGWVTYSDGEVGVVKDRSVSTVRGGVWRAVSCTVAK